jgi:hypothetical protein
MVYAAPILFISDLDQLVDIEDSGWAGSVAA